MGINNFRSISLQNGESLQMLIGNGQRVNVSTAGAGATAAVELPSNSVLDTYIVRATDWAWVAFGNGSVTAGANTSSILIAPGEGVYVNPSDPSHVSVMRVGAEDVTVQFEAVS